MKGLHNIVGLLECHIDVQFEECLLEILTALSFLAILEDVKVQRAYCVLWWEYHMFALISDHLLKLEASPEIIIDIFSQPYKL